MTLRIDTAHMLDISRTEQPLASYVLRVRGRPATLRYELHNLRTGDRRVFFNAERLAAFLREQGQDGLDGAPSAKSQATDK